MSKRWITFIWFVIVLGLALCFFGIHKAQAANQYAKVGGAGAGTGGDWTNARTTIAACETNAARGDTIFIAGGVYTEAPLRFNTANSGTTTITILHATVANHGTSTGWDDSLALLPTTITGNATASGGQVQIETQYWVFDGQVGYGDGSVEAHGFVVTFTAPADSQYIGVAAEGNGQHFTMRHVKLLGITEGNVSSYVPKTQAFVSVAADSTHLNISDCYAYNWTVDGFNINYMKTSIIEDCYFERCGTGATDGGGTAKSTNNIFIINSGWSNSIIRNNVFKDAGKTGGNCTGFIVSDGDQNHFKIYGNTFWQKADTANVTSGYICATTGDSTYYFEINNNTFVNCDDVVNGIRMVDGLNNTCYNNLFRDCVDPNYSGVTTHDYTATEDTTGLGEAHGIESTTAFTDSTNGDFTLTAQVGPGYNAGADFTPDPAGNARTTWTIGAFEYTGGASGWTGIINGVTNPTRVIDIEVANIKKINGVE